MDSFSEIDIKGKSLVYSDDDIKKLVSTEGCELKQVNERVYDLDSSAPSDDEEDERDLDDKPDLRLEAKLERMKREYISIALNTNRDPERPGEQTRLRILRPKSEEESNHDEENSDGLLIPEEPRNPGSYQNQYARIQKRYSKKVNNFDELISNEEDPFVEIVPKLVYKRQLSPGYGPRVADDSFVIYNCAFWTQGSRDPYDSSWLRCNTLMSDLSTDLLIEGFRQLLLTSRQGEWCEAVIRPGSAFGQLGVKPRIPQESTVFCLLEVVKVLTKLQIAAFSRDADLQTTLTFKDLYDASNVARMRGNYFFEQKQYRAALQRYKSGIRMLEARIYKDEAEEKDAMALLLKLYNNSAKAANALNDPRLALAFCKQSMIINELDPKTYWHRMCAWRIKGHFDKALGVARRALQLFASDQQTCKSFQREANELKKKIQVQQAELDEFHRLMGRALVNS